MPRVMDNYIERQVDAERFAFYRTVCDFAERDLAPHLLGWERAHVLLPDSAIRAMGELGLFGITVDEKYGGAGGQQLDLILMGLALGYHSHSVAITPGAAASLGIKPLQLFGSEAQKRAHLPELASGRRMFAFGLTEPGRGSDAANPEVVATKIQGGWRIRGEKCWSTNAAWASHVVVHALTDGERRHGHRTTCFLVPREHPRVHYQEMGGKQVWTQSSTGSIAFDNVEVPEDAVVGAVNEGFKIMAQTLNGGRLFVAALALASVGFALDRCRAYVQERLQFDGKPIGRFQRIQDVLVDLDIVLEQGLSWLLRLSREYDQGTMARESAAKVKIECSRRASELLTLAMEICGGVACLDEFGLQRHHRDLFVTRVGEGSNFVLKGMAVRPLLPDIRDLLQ